MTIRVRYFASLRETMGRGGDDLPITETTTVEKIWQRATRNMQRPEPLLVAINQEYATFTDKVKNGDEVAFFPPVTGG